MNKRILALLTALLLLLTACSGAETPRITQTADEWAQQPNDITVTAHGAVGDGQTDDKAAFEAAVAAALEKGERVYLPAGRYKLDAPLTVPKGVLLVFGQGASVYQTAQLNLQGAVAAPARAHIFCGGGKVSLGGVWANACWFGAKGDGKTDDTAAFEAAFAAATEVRVPYTEQGYVIERLETFRDWTLSGIEQDGKRPKLIATPETYDLLVISDGGLPDGGHATVQNIDIDMAAAPDHSTAFFFNTESGWLYDIYIRNCRITDAYYTFLDSKTTTQTDTRRAMFYVHIENVESKDNRYSTFEIVDFEGYIFFKDLVIDNSDSFTKHKLTKGFPMINVSHLAGNILQGVTLIGGNSGLQDEVGICYPGCTSVWFDGIEIRDISGYAMVLDSYITSVSNCNITNCGGGIDLTGTVEMQMNKVTVRGRKDTAKPMDGILLKDVSHTQLTNVTSTGNSGNGIFAQNSQVVLTDCSFTENVGRGIYFRGANSTKILHSVCTDNQKGQIDARGGVIARDLTVKRGQAPVSADTAVVY